MSAAEAERWAVILYGIAACTLTILLVVFVRAAFADAQKRRDEVEQELRERRHSLPS